MSSGTTFGPVYPAPLGVSFSESAPSGDTSNTDIIDPGGMDFTYTVPNLSSYTALGWGQGLPDASMDGATLDPNGGLTYSAAASATLDPTDKTAVWQGTTSIAGTAYSGTVFTELVATIVSGASGWATDTYSSATGAPAEVALITSGTFVVNLQWLASETGAAGTYESMQTFFANAGVPATSSGWLQTATDGEFAGSLPPLSVSTYQSNQTAIDAAGAPIAIEDIAADIGQSNLDSLNDPLIVSITVSDNNEVVASVAQLTSDATAIGKLINANASAALLNVTDLASTINASIATLVADSSEIGTITSTSGPVSIGVSTYETTADRAMLDKIAGGFDISDFASGISAGLDNLNGSDIDSIQIFDNKSIALDVTQLTSDATAIGKLTNANSSPVALVVTDTVPAVQNGLSTLAGAFASEISAIDVTGSGHVTIGKSTFLADDNTLNKITGGFIFADTAANIEAELGALKTDIAHVSSITTTGTTKVSAAKATFLADESILNEITGGFIFADTAANIEAELGALKTDTAHVSSITTTGATKVTVNKATFVADESILNKITGGFIFADVAANIEAELGALKTDIAHISSITATGTTKVSATKATFLADESILNKITGGFTFADAAANIEAELGALKTDIARVSSITTTGTTKVTVSKATFVADESVLNKITGGFVLSDTAANFQTELTPLEADASHVSSVHFTNATPPTLSLTSAVATADKTLLGKITSAYVLDVASAGATVTTGHGADLTIHDVAGHDTITGGGNDETFVFASGFGTATITDAAAHWKGASHDIIDFAKSEFANFQALLGDATFAHGAATITKGADHLTLDGFASAAELSAGNTAGDFKFVA